MNTRIFAACAVLLLVGATLPASSAPYELYATVVASSDGWDYEANAVGRVEGACAGGGSSCRGTTCSARQAPTATPFVRLWADDFDGFSLPAGENITQVLAQVYCSFQDGAAGDVTVRIPGIGDRSFTVNNPNCDWNVTWDITSDRSTWTEADINALSIGCTRVTGAAPTKNFWITGYRLMVVTCTTPAITNVAGPGPGWTNPVPDGQTQASFTYTATGSCPPFQFRSQLQPNLGAANQTDWTSWTTSNVYQTPALGPSLYRLYVQVKDSAGQVSDLNPPWEFWRPCQSPSVTATPCAFTTQDATSTFNFALGTGDCPPYVVQVYVDGYHTAWETLPGLQYTTPALGPGTHVIRARSIDQWGNLGAESSCNWAICFPVEITSHPQPQTVAAGGTARLSVDASGSLLNYQWVKDGNDVSGASASTLDVLMDDISKVGYYSCRVWNVCSSVVSQRAFVSTVGFQQSDVAFAVSSSDEALAAPVRGPLTLQIPELNMGPPTAGTFENTNLVKNGSFELGSYTDGGGYMRLVPGSSALQDWTVVKAVDWQKTWQPAAAGSFSLDLNTHHASGSVQQLIPGLKAGDYLLEFSFCGGAFTNEPFIQKSLKVTLGQESRVITSTDWHNYPRTRPRWERVSFFIPVPADGAAVLKFEDVTPVVTDQYVGPLIDNVILTTPWQPVNRQHDRHEAAAFPCGCQETVYQGGAQDDFAGAPEPYFLRVSGAVCPALESDLLFDQVPATTGKTLRHSFVDLPSDFDDAELSMTMALGGPPLVPSLSFRARYCASGYTLWQAWYQGAGQWDYKLWGRSPAAGFTSYVKLDLSAVPSDATSTFDLTDSIRSDGWLDVGLGDAGADFVRLTLRKAIDSLQQPYVSAATYLNGADEVTYNNCNSAFYRFTFTLPEHYRFPVLSGMANVDDQAVVFLNGHRISAEMLVPSCEPDVNNQDDPCWQQLDCHENAGDRVDGEGQRVLNWSSTDPFVTNQEAYFKPGVNELVFAVCGDASRYGEPTGVEFQASVSYSPDCNANGVADAAELAFNPALDCDQNGIIDECDVRKASNVDLVFLMDTSGSMTDEGFALCAKTEEAVRLLSALGVDVLPTFYGITGTPGAPFACLTGNVLAALGAPVPCLAGPCPAPALDHEEDWGPSTAVVAERFPWRYGVTRVIVPISDEGPQNGSPTNDPGDDRDSITNAIAVAIKHGVVVSPVVGTISESPDDYARVIQLAKDLAAGTGGTFFQSTAPDADLARAIYQAVRNAVGRGDCNRDGVYDECQLADGTLHDCNANQIPDECEISAGLSADANSNGVPDECEAAIIMQPASLVVPEGAKAVFNVVTRGVGTLGYRWRKKVAGNWVELVDGTNITGAHSDTLTIKSSQFADAGTYDVVFTDSIRSVTSDDATLTVLETVSVPEAKQKANDAQVAVMSSLVTASYDGAFYLMQPEEFAGIRAARASHGLGVGDGIIVTGTMKTTADGERYVNVAGVFPIGTGVPEPVALPIRALLGGDSSGYNPSTGAGQKGMGGGYGLNTTGLFVTSAGRVTQTDSIGRWFTFWDGSWWSPSALIADPFGNPGVRVSVPSPLVLPPSGKVVRVTGVLSCYASGGKLYPLIRLRTQADVVVVNP